MAEIKNTFIKSKMNKDLDDRLVPSGEYRDALNIAISRSEGDDVGALETILGNELFFGEETYNTCIGVYSDRQNQLVYYFVTNYIDSSVDGISNRAPDDAYCAIVKYNAVSYMKTVLVEGSFLNFSARNPIIGVNIVEDLLFWTDNRNQPRKINVKRASDLPAAQPMSGRAPSSLIPRPYYTSEDQISVAKYYPYKPILLLDLHNTSLGNIADNSTMTNPSEEYYPGGTSLKADYDPLWPGDADYLADRFIRLSYRFKFDDNEYSLMAPFTQVCFIPKQFGYFLNNDNKKAYQSTIVEFLENNVTQIIANIEFESLRPDLDLHVKEVDILYKESDALQVKVIETIPISTVVSRMQENYIRTSGNGYVYDYKYISTKPYKGLAEDQITRVYDQVPTRALAQEVSGNRVIYGNFSTIQSQPRSIDYNISYNEKLSLSLDGTNQVEYPNHTLKQNRNYQVGFVLADRYGRQSSVILSTRDTAVTSSGSNYGGSTIYVPYKPDTGTSPMDWPGYALQVLINEPIPNSNQTSVENYPGLFKDDKKGVDNLIVTTGGTTYATANNIPTTGGSGAGLTVDIINTGGLGTIAEAFVNNPGTGYEDGDIVSVTGGDGNGELRVTVLPSNPLGWYSYKIVVKQTEQDYYNAYLPGILNGYPDSYVDNNIASPELYEQGSTANIILINDNINKIPRDLEEVGPDQKQYRSSVRLFGRVAPYQFSNLLAADSNYNKQFYPGTVADSVTSISTLQDSNYNGTTLGDITADDGGGNVVSQYSLDYPEFYQFNTNPLVARVSTVNPIGKTNSLTSLNIDYNYNLAVYETEATESLLDIYWETTSTGLIGDLNKAVQEGGFEGAVGVGGFQWVLAEDSLPGTNCFQGSIQAINGFGAAINDDIEFELISVKNRLGVDISEKFVLVESGAGGPVDPKSFNIRSTSIANGDSSDSFFYYGLSRASRFIDFEIKVTYTNPSTLDVTSTFLSILAQALINRSPEIYDASFPYQTPNCSSINITDCDPITNQTIQCPVVTDFVIYSFGVSNGSLCNGDNFTDDLVVEFVMDTDVFVGEQVTNTPGTYTIKVKAGTDFETVTNKDILIKVKDAGDAYYWCNGVVGDLPRISVDFNPESLAFVEVSELNLPICDVGAQDGSGSYDPNTKIGRLRYSVLWQGLINGETYNPVLTLGANSGYDPTQLVKINNISPESIPVNIPDGDSSSCPSPIESFVADATGLERQYFDIWWEGQAANINFTISGLGMQTFTANWRALLISPSAPGIQNLESCVGGQCGV